MTYCIYTQKYKAFIPFTDRGLGERKGRGGGRRERRERGILSLLDPIFTFGSQKGDLVAVDMNKTFKL